MRSNLLQQAVILSNLLLVKTTQRRPVKGCIVPDFVKLNEHQDNGSCYSHALDLATRILRGGGMNLIQKNQGTAMVPNNRVTTFLKNRHKTDEAQLETTEDNQLLDKFSVINNLFKHLLEMTFYMNESKQASANKYHEQRSCGFLYYLISEYPNRNIIEGFYNRILNNFKKIGAESELLEAITIDLNTVIDAMGEAAKELQDHIDGKDDGLAKAVDLLQIRNTYEYYDADIQKMHAKDIHLKVEKKSYETPWTRLIDSDKPIYQKFNQTRISLEKKYTERCLPALFSLLNHAVMFYSIAMNAGIDLQQCFEVIHDIQAMNSLSLLLFDFQNIMQARRSKLRLYDLEKTIFDYFEKRISQINKFDKEKTKTNKLTPTQRVLALYENFKYEFSEFSKRSIYPRSYVYRMWLYTELVDLIAIRLLEVEYDISTEGVKILLCF